MKTTIANLSKELNELCIRYSSAGVAKSLKKGSNTNGMEMETVFFRILQMASEHNNTIGVASQKAVIVPESSQNESPLNVEEQITDSNHLLPLY